MLKRTFVGLLLVGCAAASAANVELRLSQPLSAVLKEATCLHEEPSAMSAETVCLRAGTQLTLVARMQNREVVENKSGYWYKAELAGGATGWVFSAYLQLGEASGGDAAAGASGGAP